MLDLTPLITVLVIHFNDGQPPATVPFMTREGCSQALEVTSVAENVEWSKCEGTFAPSVSMRPQARDERW